MEYRCWWAPVFGDLRASQFVEPDYGVAQPDVVLHASFEKSAKLAEDRHRVLGTFSPQCGGANKGTPLPMFDETGVRHWVAMAEMYYDSIQGAASKRLPMTRHHFTGKEFSHCGMLLIDASEEVPKSWDDMKEMLLSRFSTTPTAATLARPKRLEFGGDLDATAEEFADILANGESVPSAKAKEIFLSPLAYELPFRAFKTEFKPCAQVKA
ncbi:hypothetical protein Efla_003259 [Eimeria flavescens]